MDILMSETCWAHKKWNKIASDIKLVFHSSTNDVFDVYWFYLLIFKHISRHNGTNDLQGAHQNFRNDFPKCMHVQFALSLGLMYTNIVFPYISAGTWWLRHWGINRNVGSSVPDVVTATFHWHNPTDRTMALGSTQPLTEMSTRSISWG